MLARRISWPGLLLAACLGADAAAEPIRGTAHVLDGDTLEVGSLRIRLFGVDAPELDQVCWTADGREWPCGLAAQARLAALVDGIETGCRPRERDSYGRLIARCSAGGHDLGETLVREGLAWAYLRFSYQYADTEALARDEGAGIWQGEAQAAWHYRAGAWRPAAGQRAEEPAEAPAEVPAEAGEVVAFDSGDCGIKGNISARGDRVYHMPGTRWYARTVIETGTGERWFCSAEEAEAAGWRPAPGSG